MLRNLEVLCVVVTLAALSSQSSAALVVPAEKAAIHTEGGPIAGGWNLWSEGRVGQPIRVATAGKYRITVRAWGSVAGGVWPELALLIDGRAVKTVTVGQAEHADYRFDVELATGIHEIAAAFLNDAIIGKEDRNLYLERLTISPPADAAEPVLADKQAVAEAAEQRERKVVAATKTDIDKYRKGAATVRVVDQSGQPVPGVKISLEQMSHDFLFGCNSYMLDRCRNPADNAAYKKRFAELFNYATVGFYWQSYEWKRGRPNYDYTDKVVAWCREHGIRMKGHPLLWGNEAGIPAWSHGLPSTEIQRQRVRDIIGRYHDRIDFWEVVNEPSHLDQPKIDQPYRWARAVDPRAYLIVNDYHVLADGAPGFFSLLSAAKRNGVPFDGIGIQAHEPATMRFPLDSVETILDQYASLGKELHITEFTPTSSGKKITGSHREGVWDEAAQADYAVKFYRVCFSRPALRAITWWDLSDQGSWLPGGGMLRADMSSKPVYEQLKRLIHEEWQTRVSGTTDASGRFAFRGFYGTYRLVLEGPNGKPQQVHVAKGGKNEFIVTAAK